MKRRISLGFKEPSKLEKDIIYLTAYYGEPNLGTPEDETYALYADVISNKEFIYPINGDIHCEKKVRWCYSYRHSESIEDLLTDLVENNNGQLDHSRLIDEGCKSYNQIKEAIKKLKE